MLHLGKEKNVFKHGQETWLLGPFKGCDPEKVFVLVHLLISYAR